MKNQSHFYNAHKLSYKRKQAKENKEGKYEKDKGNPRVTSPKLTPFLPFYFFVSSRKASRFSFASPPIQRPTLSFLFP